MNPPTDPPPQPHRSSTTCDRHPDDHFSGFCPSCLFERLTTLDQSPPSSSSRRPSTSSAIKSLFKLPSTTTKPSYPELRRSQSFSASKNERFSAAAFEPQRKSCDVRARNVNPLSSLFSIENQNNYPQNQHSINTGPVIESKEEDEHDDDEIRVLEEPNGTNVVEETLGRIIDDKIRVLEEPNVTNTVKETFGEIIDKDLKTMKDHIDIDSKKPSVSFWFSKKWQKWRKKEKVKKMNTGGGDKAVSTVVEKPISRQYRETQSEIADYGFGRRSCDMDPRFSLDAGRISFDDPRYSFDEPRASWDGYMIGRTFPRVTPMVSVVEDAPVVHVSRSDAHIPVEEVETMNCINKDEQIPGGSLQTKEYYADSSSRRRKSFDRSSSIRRTAAAVVAGIDETKANSNSKVSPATIDYSNGAKFLAGNRESNSNRVRDDCLEAFELKENACANGNGERKELKKSRRWNWKIWGFIQKRGSGNRDEDEERYSRGNGIERSYSQSWQETREENLEGRVGFNPRMNRSHSSVSWRNSNNNGGTFSSGRKSNVETSGNGKKKGDELDNGLLRFYLAPLSSSRRGGGWKSRPNGSNSIASSVLRMY